MQSEEVTYGAVELGSFPTTILQYVLHADIRASKDLIASPTSISAFSIAVVFVIMESSMSTGSATFVACAGGRLVLRGTAQTPV